MTVQKKGKGRPATPATRQEAAECRAQKVGEGEKEQVPPALRARLAQVEPQGDEACQGGDGRAESADVHARQQAAPVLRKPGKQHCGGDVADDLAGERRAQKGALGERGGQKVVHLGNGRPRLPAKTKKQTR